MAGHILLALIEKLSGSDVYTAWAFAAKTYPHHKELLHCIENPT